ncbi:MAG: ThuA domain-containing protein [Gemmataceae bacterium]|nr:ThuA domain-containing protein [Gemmataceae bacterium]
MIEALAAPDLAAYTMAMIRTHVACALVLIAATPAIAAEKWADPAPKLPPGLVLWLDAARQQAAWQAHGRTLSAGARLDVWYDGSGNMVDLVQRVQASQPRFIAAGPHAVVRFDGKDDFLGLAALKRQLESCTLFLIAAPRSNPGFFRGFFAANAIGKNDYTSGLCVDLTGFGSARLDRVNVEGAGFGGAVNLLKTAHDFGGFHLLEVRSQVGPNGVELLLDGQPQGKRARTGGTLSLQQLTLGARCYSNSPDPPFIQGFLDGDIAEVLLFDRVLTAAESKAITQFLQKKHAGLDRRLAAAAATAGHRLERVAKPPPVQMLLPGFTVRQLPLDLPNINNVKYRADGKLVALGYNGNIYLLSDTNGDGLEDRAELFWDNQGRLQSTIGMDLTPPGYAHGQGVFVASKGKVSLIVDTNADDRADKEIVVATGWRPLPHGVDALGVAVGKDGAVYFGLGTTNYTNAYQLDKGKARYDLKDERGTIMKVAPDFKSRAIVATGIRFPVALRFNHLGDLFATDQEGATWLPNGNPFDELLHIQPGRHYGFPPRHPVHLPGVIDEPSAFDYGPQHQSTCGLNFNGPPVGWVESSKSTHPGPGREGGFRRLHPPYVFGPKEWANDAIVCGYSRGKIYRTKLVKGPSGYVAQTQIIACLNMLTVDACVSPGGQLVVAAHSGPPDWGTGPAGKGKLYKIAHDRQTPVPLFAYPAGPREVRVAFHQPLDPALLKDLAKHATIEYGPFVRPGDRFETLKPPYAIVQQQDQAPRFHLPVLGVSVTPDRRTLIVQTAPNRQAAHYALTLPGLGRPTKPGPGELPQLAATELGYDLSGVQAEWLAKGGERWSGCLPHFDIETSKALTAGSSDHDRLWSRLAQKGSDGRLNMRGQLDLWQMLRPALQPGTTIDYSLPEESVSVLYSAPDELVAIEPEASHVILPRLSDKGMPANVLVFKPQPDKTFPVNATVNIASAKGALQVSWRTKEDERPRTLALHRILAPWAQRKADAVVAERLHPDLEGGSWVKGRAVFFGDAAQCARCHVHRGQGARIGPDLTNLVHRDYDSVVRDIRFPNATLNPDHLSYTVTALDGRTLLGTLRTDGQQVIVGTNEGKEHRFAKDEVESALPSPISTMPEGLDKKLSAAELRDLLTFLLTEPLKPAPLERDGAPPPRSRQEVEAILKTRVPLTGPLDKVHIVLAAGPKDHGPGEHDYPLWQRRWLNLFGMADKVTVSTAMGWPSPKQWDTADVIVFYSHHAGWSADKAKDLDAFLARGGGLVYLHFAVEGHRAADVLAERIGLAWRGGQSRFRHGPLELTFLDPKHPITRGFDKVRFVDESYWRLAGDPKKIHVLATGVEEGAAQPLFWTREHEKGRVFVSILGHYTWTFDDPLFRALILRGIAWSARQPVDRWLDLATLGARWAE